MRAIDENDRRIQEINEKIPEIKEINNAIFNSGKELISTIISAKGKDISQEIERIKALNLSAQDMSRNMLVSNGYPADYLRRYLYRQDLHTDFQRLQCRQG